MRHLQQFWRKVHAFTLAAAASWMAAAMASVPSPASSAALSRRSAADVACQCRAASSPRAMASDISDLANDTPLHESCGNGAQLLHLSLCDTAPLCVALFDEAMGHVLLICEIQSCQPVARSYCGPPARCGNKHAAPDVLLRSQCVFKCFFEGGKVRRSAGAGEAVDGGVKRVH